MAEKPTCFVAMSFGKEDTNKLYENLILPVLKNLNIRPIIINRQEKNDDLNIQIIEELKFCDFAIADLTYARPSVYFEAGFAQRAVEVIYTVRADHLEINKPDELRVHFDLQMKNLIIWSGTNDKEFSEKLSRRIEKTFLQKWNLQNNENTKNKLEENELKTLPQITLLKLIRNTAIDKLSEKGYKKWLGYEPGNRYDNRYGNKYIFPEDEVLQGKFNNVYSIIKSQSEIKLSSINSFGSATRNAIEQVILDYREYPIQNIIGDFLNKGMSVTLNHFIFSVRSIPDSRIKDLLFTFYKSPDGSMYTSDSNIKIYRSQLEIPVRTNFYFISNITRITKFENELNNHMNKNLL